MRGDPWPADEPTAFRSTRVLTDLPVIFEDDGYEEAGEPHCHTIASTILHYGLIAHLPERFAVFADLDLFYHPTVLNAYLSADAMVVEPFMPLGDYVNDYRIGRDGPAPVLAAEILSYRSDQQGDLTVKQQIYAALGVRESILLDTTGEYLKGRLLLRRLQPDGTWLDSQDPDGGVTSALGFRIVFDDDEMIRIVNVATGEGYARPTEANAHREARLRAEDEVRRIQRERSRIVEETRALERRNQELEAEVARLRALLPPDVKD